MDWTAASYFTYLAVTVPLTIWVASTLSSNGRAFLVDVFEDNTALADAINKLLVVGFYLLNVGFARLDPHQPRPVPVAQPADLSGVEPPPTASAVGDVDKGERRFVGRGIAVADGGDDRSGRRDEQLAVLERAIRRVGGLDGRLTRQGIPREVRCPSRAHNRSSLETSAPSKPGGGVSVDHSSLDTS